MKPRFEVRENTPNSFAVIDTQATAFHRLIAEAVTIYMREEAAISICKIMNEEWNAFLKNPT